MKSAVDFAKVGMLWMFLWKLLNLIYFLSIIWFLQGMLKFLLLVFPSKLHTFHQANIERRFWKIPDFTHALLNPLKKSFFDFAGLRKFVTILHFYYNDLKEICMPITLTIKTQNIGASTKMFCKQMFNFDTLDSNKWKYRSLGSFKKPCQ